VHRAVKVNDIFSYFDTVGCTASFRYIIFELLCRIHDTWRHLRVSKGSIRVPNSEVVRTQDLLIYFQYGLLKNNTAWCVSVYFFLLLNCCFICCIVSAYANVYLIDLFIYSYETFIETATEENQMSHIPSRVVHLQRQVHHHGVISCIPAGYS